VPTRRIDLTAWITRRAVARTRAAVRRHPASHSLSWLRAAALGTAMLALGAARATAQEPSDDPASVDTEFRPLLAAPREPSFFATYLHAQSPRLASKIGAVGMGQTFNLVRSRRWDLAIAGGVFAQFSMESPTNDLINTDFVVGVPLTFRLGGFATRVRLYHQSSHMGDEYLLRTSGAERTDLTFEALELLVAHQTGPWRAYAGGEYALTRSPSDLGAGAVRGGLEYRGRRRIVQLGRLARGRVVAGLDVAAVDVRGGKPAWSFVGGLEMSSAGPESRSTWHWSLLLTAYTGPTPYGQFFRDPLSAIGIGVSFAR
jgi:hypothetical protein